ncbi:MAG: permease-like cell division protein FtsX [Kofleriaceae bacterium]
MLRRTGRWFAGGVGARRAVAVASFAFAATVALGAALTFARSAARWSALGRGSQLVVYLGAAGDARAGLTLTEELRALGGVTRAEYVPPAETLRRLRSALGEDQRLAEGLDPEAMPASIELALEPGVDAVLPLSPTIAALRRHPAVDDVAVERAPADRLGEAMTALRPWLDSGSWFVAALAALLLTIGARLAWAPPRGHAAVAHLLGAGPAYQVLPASLAAAIAAAAGALAAVAALSMVGGALGAALAPQGLAPALLTGGEAGVLALGAVAVAATSGGWASVGRGAGRG